MLSWKLGTRDVCCAFLTHRHDDDFLGNKLVSFFEGLYWRSSKVASQIAQATREFLVGNQRDIISSLEALQNAYQPRLDIQGLRELIAERPTEIQGSIGLAKYIRGVRINGSVQRVTID
jgi:hypothetical protein